MEIELVHREIEIFDINFQKIFDYMNNESNVIDGSYAGLNKIDYYDTVFGDNVEYYLEKVYNLNFNSGDDFYYELGNCEYKLSDGFYNWLNENKERLNLID